MSLDERLRTDLRRVPLDGSADVKASLQAVVRDGTRRRRRRQVIPPVVAAVVAVGLIAVAAGARSRQSSTVEVLTPSPSATAPATVAPPPDVTGATTSEPPTSEAAPTTSSTPAPTSPPSSVPPPSRAPASTTTSSPAPTVAPPAPVGGSVPVDLRFTGVVNGHVTSGTVAPAGIVVGPHLGGDHGPACTNAMPDDGKGATFGVVGTLAGNPFLLSYSVGDIHDVSGGLAEGLAIVGHPTLQYNQGLYYDPGKVVVDPDRLGGQIDADLYQSGSSGQPVVVGHVAGHFRCAP
jgi:hypothetical protein